MLGYDASILNKADLYIKLLSSLLSFAGLVSTLWFQFKAKRRTRTVDVILGKNTWSREDKETIKETMDRQSRIIVFAASFIFIYTAVSLILVVISPTSSDALARYLDSHDSQIFEKGKPYEIARGFSSRGELTKATSFSQDLERTTASFDILANSGPVLRDHTKEIRNALMRGVTIRIILSNPGKANAQNLDAFQKAVGQHPDEARAMISSVTRDLLAIQRDVARSGGGIYRGGSIDIKYNTNPILYSMWVSDKNLSKSIGHISLSFYRARSEWPSFRFSRDGKILINNLVDEFNYVWNSANSVDINYKNYKNIDGIMFKDID